MAAEHAAYLEAILGEATEWPPKDAGWAWSQVREWAAFRESDPDPLTPSDWDTSRTYIVDPLPERIADAFADLIFGEDPVFTAASEKAQTQLDLLIDDNDLPSELQRAAGICSSEGEVWSRIVVDRDASPSPILEWHSRSNVYPLFHGRQLLACAFIATYRGRSDTEVFRYVEIHADGIVLNRLYQGTTTSLGDRVNLAQLPQTEGLNDDWRHDFPMLATRIPNKLGRNPSLGVSDYSGVRNMLLALNEARSIGQENARLTAKQRVVVPQRFLDENGRFPSGAEVIVATDTDQDPDKAGQGVAQIEWSFDAQALIAYTEDLTDTILTRTRVAPQLVGRHTEGAQTGPALRARLLDSVLAANGKARYWDDAVPKILQQAQLVASLPTNSGGYGIKWDKAGDPPSVERTPALPTDESEDTNRIATEISSEFLSRQTAIEQRHPDWDEDRVEDEMRRIREENALPVPRESVGGDVVVTPVDDTELPA